MQQQLTQRHTRFLTAGKIGDRQCILVFGKAQSFEYAADTAAVSVSILAFIGSLQTGILLHQFGGRVILHFGLHTAHLFLHTAQRLEYLEQLIFDTLVRLQFCGLRQISDDESLLNVQAAAIGRIMSAKYMKKGGFAGAICAYESDLLLGFQMKGDIGQNLGHTECFSEMISR